MSSFHEEKGLGFIRSKPKDYVRYNLKQNSRVYPAGSRIASSNYMPQVSNNKASFSKQVFITGLFYKLVILECRLSNGSIELSNI